MSFGGLCFEVWEWVCLRLWILIKKFFPSCTLAILIPTKVRVKITKVIWTRGKKSSGARHPKFVIVMKSRSALDWRKYYNKCIPIIWVIFCQTNNTHILPPTNLHSCVQNNIIIFNTTDMFKGCLNPTTYLAITFDNSTLKVKHWLKTFCGTFRGLKTNHFRTKPSTKTAHTSVSIFLIKRLEN